MNNKKLIPIFILSGTIFALQGIEGLPMLAVTLYLKETLHISVSNVMYITSLITLPWFLKPIIGFYVDCYLTDRIYIRSALIIAFILTLTIIILPVVSIYVLIIALITINICSATRNITVDGVICTFKKEDISKIQSVQWGANIAISIIVGLAGGYLAENFSYKVGFGLLLIAYIFTFISTIKFKTEKVIEVKDSFIETIKGYKELFTDKKFLFCALFCLVYNFAPTFATPLLFVQREEFKWSATFIGMLAALVSFIQVIGCIIYFKYGHKWNLKKLFKWTLVFWVVSNIAYLYYTPVTAIGYDIFYAIYIFMFLGCNTLMARCVVKGKETTSFALLCSANNIAGVLSNISGGLLFDLVGLNWLIVICSIFPLVSIFLIKKIED